MDERFVKIFSMPLSMYAENAPLIIEAGVLLKDKSTDKMLIQLKFRNSSENPIIAVNVSITCYALSGETIENIKNHQILDLNAAYGIEFGQKNPIFLNNSNTRSFSVSVDKVVFADKSVWTIGNDTDWQEIPMQTKLSAKLNNISLIEQYKRDTTHLAEFTPIEYKDIWVCCCGAINKTNPIHSSCRSCSTPKDKVFTLLNTDILLNNKNNYDIESKKAEEMNKQKTAKTKKKIISCSIFAFIFIVLLIIFGNISHTRTENRYQNAIALLEEDDYTAAIDAFSALGQYKDCYEMKYAIYYYENNDICSCIKKLMYTYEEDASRVLLAKIAHVAPDDIQKVDYSPWRNVAWKGEYKIMYSNENGYNFYSILDY